MIPLDPDAYELQQMEQIAEHIRAHGDLKGRLIDRLLERSDVVHHELDRLPWWRLLRRHTLQNELIGLAGELQSIEQNVIAVEGHVREHMRQMGLVK